MDLLPFFVVLLAAALFSVAFRRFNLPWVLSLIIAGVVIGPFGLKFVEVTPTIEFIGQIGLIFLMFMAGLETKLESFREFKKGIVVLSLLNSLVPFAAGYAIGHFFGFEPLASLLLGIIFMSSSVAVIVPTLESIGILNSVLGRSVLSATIIEDVASLVFLSILLQSIDPITSLPLPSFYAILAVLLVAFRYGLPKIRELIPRKRAQKDLFESEVHVIVVMLIGVVIIFELLGLHSIIAAFFAGLVLSESIKSEILIDKLHTISYGIFIPVFFVIIGMETNIGVFSDGLANFGLLFAVVFCSIVTKFFSGWIGGRISGFRNHDALVVGVATIPQLSTTLAVVYTAVERGLLQSELITAMVVLSIVTTLLTPLLMKTLEPKAGQAAA